MQYGSDKIELSETSKLCIVNDSFGALACALNKFNPTAISDSFVSQQATRFNLKVNNLPIENIQLYNSLDWPEQPYDLILIKIPKTLALLEDQLIRLQPLLTAETKVIAAGMVKAMSSSVWKLIEHYLGSTAPSLAKKKARLIFITLNAEKKQWINPYPVYYQLENTQYTICNHANVFSRESLDIGTRFLLQHLPKKNSASDIVDLGCGNGVVGLMLAHYYPAATLYFIDESYMAVASAKENFQSAYIERRANYKVSNGLLEFELNTMDLIVCNPPFHQQNTVGNQIALAMFKQSQCVLRKGGELWVIGNRHLAYHLNLKKIFGQCEEMASNTKFIIWRMIK